MKVGKRGPLHAALEDMQRSAPVSVLARELNVAPSTLKRILGGQFVDLGGKEQTQIDPKQRRAWAETITHLAKKVSESSVASVEPVAALREFGLFAHGDKVVEAAISRGKFEESQESRLKDVVLANIDARVDERLRAAERIEGVVRVGILSWPPISDPNDDRSFGHQFCRRLFGTLNPVRWKVVVSDRTTITDCLSALRAGTKGDDVAFGVYSTVSRQLAGLDFIPVPGIGVPLHALFHKPDHLKNFPVDWGTIAKRSDFGDVGVQATVLEEEVGQLYLRGPCGYDEVIALPFFDPDAIAQALSNPPSDKVSIFVADRPTCLRVAKAMEGKAKQTSLRKSEAVRDWSHDPSFPGTDFNEPGFPVYRLGMAIRADAARWKTLLTTAIQEELFRNDLAWTALLYAQLICKHFKELSLVPLEPLLPAFIAQGFARSVHSLLCERDEHSRRRDQSLDPQTRNRLHRELRDNWGLPEDQCDDECQSNDARDESAPDVRAPGRRRRS